MIEPWPMTEERRRVQLAAEAVFDQRRTEMITSPSGSSEHIDINNASHC